MFLRLLTLTILGLSLTACKVEFKGYADIDTDGVGLSDSELDIYQSLRYFNGGWYGPYPNYTHDLTLTLNANKTVTATLKTPSCEIKSSLHLNDYRSLISEVLNSPAERQNDMSMIDGGDKVISLTEKNQETHYFLRVSDNSRDELIIKQPQRVEAALQKIIAKIEKTNVNCNDPVVGVEYSQTTSVDYISMSDARFVIPGGQANLDLVARSVSLDLSAQFLKAKSEGFVSTTEVNYCRQSYSGHVHGSILEAANKLKIKVRATTTTATVPPPCYFETIDKGLNGSLKLIRKSGKVESANLYSGCGEASEVENFKAFETSLEKILNSQDLHCAAMGYKSY